MIPNFVVYRQNQLIPMLNKHIVHNYSVHIFWYYQ